MLYKYSTDLLISRSMLKGLWDKMWTRCGCVNFLALTFLSYIPSLLISTSWNETTLIWLWSSGARWSVPWLLWEDELNHLVWEYYVWYYSPSLDVGERRRVCWLYWEENRSNCMFSHITKHEVHVADLSFVSKVLKKNNYNRDLCVSRYLKCIA